MKSKRNKVIIDRAISVMLTTMATMIMFVMTFNGPEINPWGAVFLLSVCSMMLLSAGCMWTLTYLRVPVKRIIQEEYEVTDD